MIKKYNLFESYWEEDDFWNPSPDDKDFVNKLELNKEEKDIIITNWNSITKESNRQKVVSLMPYIDYIKIDDMVYHESFGWGYVVGIRPDRQIIRMSFRGEEKDIRPSAIDMKISKSMADFIEKQNLIVKEKPVEKKEESFEDLREKNEGLQKRLREMSQKIVLYSRESSVKSSKIISANETIKKLGSEIDRLQKQLNEYESLKDAMKEFKEKVDPFGEETWSKKKK